MPSLDEYRARYDDLRSLSDSEAIQQIAKVNGVDVGDVTSYLNYEPPGGDFLRQLKNSWTQTKQLGAGLGAAAAATAETSFGEGGLATGLKKAAVEKYKEIGNELQINSKASDSLSYSWEEAHKGNFGALVDWTQGAFGMGIGQIGQAIGTAGVGGIIGRTVGKKVVEGALSEMVEKEAKRLVLNNVAEDAAKKQAVSNVASRIGQNAAIGAQVLGMEGGEIGGDLAARATEEGRILTGAEIARALAATVVAAGPEAITERWALDAMTGKLPWLKAMEEASGVKGKTARAGMIGAAGATIGAGQEFAQTYIEEAGKGNEINDQTLRMAIDAAGMGAVGGAIPGVVGGLVTSPNEPAAQAPAEEAPPNRQVTLAELEQMRTQRLAQLDQEERGHEGGVVTNPEGGLDVIAPKMGRELSPQEKGERLFLTTRPPEAIARRYGLEIAKPADAEIAAPIIAAQDEDQAIVEFEKAATANVPAIESRKVDILGDAGREAEQALPGITVPDLAPVEAEQPAVPEPLAVEGVSAPQAQDVAAEDAPKTAMQIAFERAQQQSAARQPPADQAQATQPTASMDATVAAQQAVTAPQASIDVAPQALPEATQQAAPVEQRNPTRQERIAQMTPADIEQELYVSRATGIKNRRALDEDMQEGKKAVTFIDLDGLKYINDTFGHEKGNELLKKFADAMKAAGIDGYHVSGDEFAILSDDMVKAKKAIKTLETEASKVRIDSDTDSLKGITFSYGMSKDLATADANMQKMKASREQAGLRVRGGRPPNLVARLAPPSQPAPQQAPTTPAPRGRRLQPFTDNRLSDPEARLTLQAMADAAGWAEAGGRLTRDSEGNVGRTKWIPRADWFGDIQADKGSKLTGNLKGLATRVAVQKALSGEPMTEAQKRHVIAMLEWKSQEQLDYDAQNTGSIDPFTLLMAAEDVGIDHGESLSDEALAARALEIDEEAVNRAMAASEYESEFLDEMRRIVDGEAQRQGEDQAVGGSGAQVQGAEAGQASQEGFSLAGQTEAERAAEDARLASANKAERDRQTAAEQKARADRDVGGFRLSGSDLPADQAAAAGQGNLLESATKPETRKAEAQEVDPLPQERNAQYGRLRAIAENLGVLVVASRGGWRASKGQVEIPAEDTEVEGAVSASHVFAHELGHTVLQQRGISYSGFPSSELIKQVPGWVDMVEASKKFRPGVHRHESARIRRYAKKPNEIMADAIGSVLLGQQPVSLLTNWMDSVSLTPFDLGVQPRPKPATPQVQPPDEATAESGAEQEPVTEIGGYPVSGLGEKALKVAAKNATSPADRKAAKDELARRAEAPEDKINEREATTLPGGQYPTVREADAADSGQLSLFAAPTADKRQAYADLYGTVIKARTVAHLKASSNSVKAPEDVAHLLAAIRKNAQEALYAVVADKTGKVLRVIQHTRGLKAESQVSPLTLIAEVASIPGAARVHLGHNHPSGIATPSTSDVAITDKIRSLMDGTGISLGHHVVVAGKAWGNVDAPGHTTLIEPLARTTSVPVTERVITKRGTVGDRITTPDAAVRVTAGHKDAVFLLNAQHDPVGIVPLTADEMKTLRSGGSVNRLLSAINTTNASAAIIKTDDRSAALNVIKFLNRFDRNDLRVLDWISAGGVSMASSGDSALDATGPFFSRGQDTINVDGVDRPTQNSEGRQGEHTVASVTSAIEAKLGKGVLSKIADNFKIVKDMAALKDDMKARGSKFAELVASKEGFLTKGLYDPSTDTSYIVAGNLGAEDSPYGIFLHEVGEHYGLEKMLGQEAYAGVLNQAQMILRAGGKAMREAAVRVNASENVGLDPDAKNFHRLFADKMAGNKRLSREVIAYLADNPKNHELPFMRRIMVAVREFMRKLGFTKPLTTDDIVSLIVTAARRSGEFSQRRGEASTETIKFGGEARPTTNSEGQPIHPTEDGIRNFWRWFGGSRVVDADGKPLVVYHGTNADLTDFDTAPRGSFFTDSQQVASGYGRPVPVYLAMKNPVIIDAKGAFWNELDTVDSPALDELRKYGRVVVMDHIKSAAEKAGYDGAIVMNVVDNGGATNQYIAFRPEQIKSVIGNQGSYDPSDPSILRSSGQRTAAQAIAQQTLFSRKNLDEAGSLVGSKFTLPAETFAQKAQRYAQDEANRFQVVQDAVVKQGGTVDESSNIADAIKRYPGRLAAAMKDTTETLVEPFAKRIHDAGTTTDEVSLLAYAEHAPERNAEIAKINPRFPNDGTQGKSGSGMTDQEAADIIKQVKAMPNAAEMFRLSQELRDITDQNLDNLVAGGEMEQSQADEYRKRYKFYVPLKGFELVDESGMTQPTGKGLSTGSRLGFRAMGRESRAGQIFEHVIQDYENGLMLSEKAVVAKTLRNFIKANPDDALWTIDNAPKKPRLEKGGSLYQIIAGGNLIAETASKDYADRQVQALLPTDPTAYVAEVKPSPKGLVKWRDSPFDPEEEIRFIENGKPVRIQLADAGMVRSYNRLWHAGVSDGLTLLNSYNGWLRQMYTQKNPAWFFMNAQKDVLSVMPYVTGEAGIKTALKIPGNIPGAFKAARAFHHGKTAGAKWNALIDQFKATGGYTGFAFVGDIEAQTSRLNGAIARHTGWDEALGKFKGKGIRAGVSAVGAKVLNTRFFSWIEAMNSTFENMTRLAVFKSAIDSGMTPNEAGKLAKNASTNFNTRGEWGPNINAVWLFANAGIQGTRNVGHALAFSPHKEQVWALMGGLVALGMMAGLMSDDDDDLLDDQIRSKALVFKVGDTQLSLPMPYGFGFFSGFGQLAAQAMKHPEKRDNIALKMATLAFDHFSPVGDPLSGEADLKNVVNVAPTSIRPVLNVAANVSPFGGGPLLPESPYDETKPDSTKMWTATRGTGYDNTAKWLNALTGGDQYKAGAISVSPETLKLSVSTLFGGAGKLASDILSLPFDVGNETLAPSKVPILKNYVREIDQKAYLGRFYQQAQEAQDAYTIWRRYLKAGMVDEATSYKQGEAAMISMGGLVSSYRKQIKMLRDMESMIVNSDLSPTEKNIRLAKTNASIVQITSAFNDRLKSFQ